MEGVEILATDRWLEEFQFSFPAAFGILCFCIMMGAILAYKEKECLLGALVGLFVGLIGGTVFGSVVGALNVDAFPVYKVTIANDVSLNDFMQKYEILDQDGKIYTVKEKTTDVD